MTDHHIQRIDAWRTSDGKVHTLLSSAEEWQLNLNGAVIANRMLQAGANLLDVLLCSGLLGREGAERMPELAEITKDTKLIISHLQCRDQPGYQPIRVTPDGSVYVYGDAGSWSGPYGDLCRPDEVVRYWLDTKRRAKP